MDTATLARNWWAIALRGVAAIIFGILAFVLPGITLAALVLLFGVYAFVDGVFSLVAAVRGRGGAVPWWALVIEGVAGIAAGLITFFLPRLTALTLLYVIAVWSLVTGVLEIVAAVRMRKTITNEWWLVGSGVLSVAFGVFLALFPGAGALALVLWV